MKQYKVLLMTEHGERTYYLIAESIEDATERIKNMAQITKQKIDIISITKEKEYPKDIDIEEVIEDIISKSIKESIKRVAKDIAKEIQSEITESDDEVMKVLMQEDQTLPYNERSFSEEGKKLILQQFTNAYNKNKKKFNDQIDKLLQHYVEHEAYEKAAYIRDIKIKIQNG